MAARLLSYEVADLCLGKPSLPSLSISATIGDAVAALKGSEDNFISVWSCNHSKGNLNSNDCVCVGKICMVDIICYLCKEENLLSPSLVLQSPVSVLLSKVKGLVKHVEPSSRYWMTLLSLWFLFVSIFWIPWIFIFYYYLKILKF